MRTARNIGGLAAAVTLVLTPLSAYAVPALEPIVSPYSGSAVTSGGPSAGSLLGSMLEAAGYQAQMLVLTDLADLLLGLGVLFFLVTAMVALGIYVVTHSADRALWFFLGPVIFWLLVGTTTNGGPVEWRRDQAITDNRFEVSWVFHRFNNFVSSISRELIKVITAGRSQEIMSNFMTREQILTDLLGTRIKDGGLVSFSIETMHQCSACLDAARIIALGERDALYAQSAEYANAKQSYETRYRVERKPISSNVSREYVRQLLGGLSQEMGPFDDTNKLYGQCLQQTTASIQRAGSVEALINGGMTCEELWCWMGLGVMREVRNFQSETEIRYGLPKAAYEQIWNDIVLKLSAPTVQVNYDGTPLQGVTPVSPDPSVIPIIIGGYLLRDLMKADFHSGALSQFASHAGVIAPSYNFQLSMPVDQMQDVVQRFLQHQIAEGKKYEVFQLAMLLPYLQAILIYFLSISFPFFALLVLIPGRGHGFFVWMKAWVWAKSWDIGWGLVALLENFLWNMMPHSALYDPLLDPNHGPISMFDTAFQADPAYSLGNYYTIVGLLVVAVPIVSAQILLGAHAHLVMPVLKGLRSYAETIGGQASVWAAVEQQGRIDSMRENFMINATREKFGTDADAWAMNFRHNVIGALEAKAKEAEKIDFTTLDVALGGPLGHNPGGLFQEKMRGKDAAIYLRRMANAARADLEYYNASVHMFNAAQSDEYFTLDSIRAGLSGRGEHWNLPEPPTEALKHLKIAEINAQAQSERAVSNVQTAKELGEKLRP